MRFSLISLASVLAISAATIQTIEARTFKFRRAYPDDYSPKSCHPVKFTDFVVFGDSYADSGNTYKLTKKSWPGPKYYHGRFSNGYVWPEYVAEHKGYHHANYAYDGATSDNRLVQGYTGPKADIPVPGFWQQIQRYHEHYNDKHDSKKLEETLFVINFQGFDYHFKHDLDVDVVIKHYEQGLRWLIEMGAKHIYVVGGIDVTKTPYLLTEHGEDREKVHDLVWEHLSAFKHLVQKLHYEYGRPASDDKPFQWCPADYKYLYDHEHSDRKTFANHVNVAWYDTEALLEWLRTTPSALKKLGITNLVKGCYDEGHHTVCPTPEKYLYWDNFHLTTKIHKELAYAIEKHL
ncbi:hypothetical protein BGZ73_005989 [Actinomortierella ambigua]|nr:hypothetical protein BGZ73_005989 [Actinomortierella ambigua]